MASPSLLTSTVLLLATLSFFIPTRYADDVMYSGNTLYGGYFLSYGNYFLVMQTDCNLVLYDNGQVVWSSGTSNLGLGCTLQMQTDGNLVIYDLFNRALWASNTGGQQGYYVLVLQRDRNVVIYGGAIWGAGTNAIGTATVVISGNSTHPAEVAGDKITMVTGK
ncbi:hypothetical protein LUZ61_015399 [Rhynchospora tenuis]|uniref:non-specific serine/threonine protein kinase n=1 Tax=Rhynchospora tenuis TaxID=198213 RepID=A0AAD5WD53_9POAL|nr:hypothetical protein LUZ61_015399 [Rhynchospora tenuis]